MHSVQLHGLPWDAPPRFEESSSGWNSWWPAGLQFCEAMPAVQDASRVGTMALNLTCLAKPSGAAEFAPVQASGLDLVRHWVRVWQICLQVDLFSWSVRPVPANHRVWVCYSFECCLLVGSLRPAWFLKLQLISSDLFQCSTTRAQCITYVFEQPHEKVAYCILQCQHSWQVYFGGGWQCIGQPGSLGNCSAQMSSWLADRILMGGGSALSSLGVLQGVFQFIWMSTCLIWEWICSGTRFRHRTFCGNISITQVGSNWPGNGIGINFGTIIRPIRVATHTSPIQTVASPHIFYCKHMTPKPLRTDQRSMKQAFTWFQSPGGCETINQHKCNQHWPTDHWFT